MKKQRLLYALESAGGGTLKHVTLLATRLNRDEFDITVVLPNETYEADTQAAVEFMRQKGIRVDTVFMPERISRKYIRALCGICSYLRRQRFDMVHAHSSKAGALFRMAACLVHVPVMIYTPHCFYFQSHTGCKRWFFVWIERMLARRTDVIVISGTEQTVLKRERIRPSAEVAVIDNAVAPDEYTQIDYRQARAAWKIPDGHKVIIGVGRLVKQKNWNSFLETARMVLQYNRNVTFLIAGEGPLRNHLTECVLRCGMSDHVRICGHVDPVDPLYSMADVFLATSLWEGLPYTYLEAYYFRVPIVITHTDGMEYFVSQTGIVCVPQKDTRRLCDEILNILSGSSLSNKCCPTETNVPLERFVERHQDMYRRHSARIQT
jgi:glycosyltransferase involved in cell wall biosynthesis